MFRAHAAPAHLNVQVHVNELLGGAETAAYLIKYDSVHGAAAVSEAARAVVGSA